MAIDEKQTIVWDFGFLDESEIDGVQQAYDQVNAAQGEIAAAKGTAAELQNRLDRLYEAYKPLLANLKKEPHKDYVLFPDRGPKIEAFESILADIYYGK